MTEIENLGDRPLVERLKLVENELTQLRNMLGSVATLQSLCNVDLYVFPGGAAPKRQTDGAIGYDAFARAVVDPLSKPTIEDPLRRTMADFKKKDGWEDNISGAIKNWATDDPIDNDKYAIALPPGERLMLGLGFATRMEYPMYYWVAPRSGYAAKGITVANSPGTVDPDYRGEAGALLENNSRQDFLITHHMRVVQVIFGLALIPNVIEVSEHDELGSTNRGAGGFGSTGTH